MNTRPLSSAVFLVALLAYPALRAQEPPTARPAQPDFQVLSRTVTREMATEPAPLPGMTPVTRERTITVDVVADPHLPAPAPPPPPANPNDPALKARFAALRAARAAYQPMRMVGFSATTYDFTWTRLVWRAKSRPAVTITAWSNIPFTYISGHDELVMDGKKYMLCCGSGVETTAQGQRRAARLGVPYVPPVIPELPDLATVGPAFVITAGDATGTPELEFLTALHAVWPAEAPRFKAAHEAREVARMAHETYVRAHPPAPQDIHLRVWEIKGEPQTATQAR